MTDLLQFYNKTDKGGIARWRSAQLWTIITLLAKFYLQFQQKQDDIWSLAYSSE
jgi:hypothetical protein